MKKRTTKKAIKEFVKHKLKNDEKWAIDWLMEINERQTYLEQVIGETEEANGEGFSMLDADFLGSLADQWKSRKKLSKSQLIQLHKRIPRYWRQVVEIMGEEQVVKTMMDLKEMESSEVVP